MHYSQALPFSFAVALALLTTQKKKLSITKIYKRMEDFEAFVGLSVKVGNMYGIIDEVCGSRLGLVWSDKDSWTGQIVDANDVTICETENDCESGRLSALNYFERESESLQSRINMGRKQDDLTTLVNELSRCEYWLSRLS